MLSSFKKECDRKLDTLPCAGASGGGAAGGAAPVVDLGVVGRGNKRLQLAPVAQQACARPARP